MKVVSDGGRRDGRSPSDAPFTNAQLLARADAEATFDRLRDAGTPDLVVELVGLAALRARAAAERCGR